MNDLVERLRAAYRTAELDDIPHLVAVFDEAATAIEAKDAEIAALRGQVKELKAVIASLSNPAAVHINMLRGGIAKPSWLNIRHLYPTEFAEVDARAETAERKIVELEQVRDALNDRSAQYERDCQKLKLKLNEAREALKPFAYYYDINYFEGRSDDDAIEISMRDIRAARAIIEKE